MTAGVHAAGDPRGHSRPARGALAVAAGIFCSRVAGLVRTSVLGSVFGVGPYADVLAAALRLPNLIQNLLGEQTLSASFIPVYARLLGEGRKKEAGRFAGAIFSLLVAVAGGLALAGVLLARPLVAIFATGFLRDRDLVAQGAAAVDRYPLAVAAVQWVFPMTALLVLSAWALGVLNSHGRFFLSYVAPVAWNAAIVAAVVWIARGSQGAATSERLLTAACVGALAGGALQFLIQIPGVMREVEGWSFGIRFGWAPVREAIAAFLPTVAGRGVVQLSSYLDQILASLLAAGAVSALGYAQTLYLLPISLFGLSVAAAALPDLARRRGAGEIADPGEGLRGALTQASFLNLPATVAYLLLGLPLVQGLFQLFGGRFGEPEIALVALVLGAYALGLPAATSSRVLQAGLYAGGEARIPARTALLRVGVALSIGLPLMLLLDRFALTSATLPGFIAAMRDGATLNPRGATASGTELRMGAVGLALAASVSAWVELLALRRAAKRRWRSLARPRGEPARFLGFAVLAAAAPAALHFTNLLAAVHPTARAAGLLALFALTYLTLARREEPARAFASRLRTRK
jgi:putative peptidoglycan lipid II flippase